MLVDGCWSVAGKTEQMLVERARSLFLSSNIYVYYEASRDDETLTGRRLSSLFTDVHDRGGISEF